MRSALRVAIIQPEMAPNRFACFSALGERKDVELLVLYLERGNRPFDWTKDEEHARFIRATFAGQRRFGIHLIPPGLMTRLWRFQPDVTLLGGWDEPSYFLIAAFKKILGTRLVVWTESTASDHRGASRFRKNLKRSLLESADGVMLPGSAAKSYCETINAGTQRWFVAPNAIDNDYFASGAWQPEIRRSDDSKATVFLYVGRLDPEKGVDVLVRAWSKVESETNGSLVIVGTGSQEDLLKRAASETALSRIKFVGFVPQALLPKWYASAHVFVFPSLSDPWGLVINEAMASGLPIITTSAPGAVAELVADGVNGLLVPTGDEKALAEAILLLAEDEELRTQMGRRSRDRICKFSPALWAEAVARMAKTLA